MSVQPTMNRNEVLRKKLELLRQMHRELDTQILAEEADFPPDQIQLSHMKKRKLSLKDEIARIEDDLTPDIIA